LIFITSKFVGDVAICLYIYYIQGAVCKWCKRMWHKKERCAAKNNNSLAASI